MNFYNLNIKHHKDTADRNSRRVSHAAVWLDERLRVPIFYRKSTIANILDNKAGLLGRARSEAKRFCEIGKNPGCWDETLIVTIDDGQVWIYKPSGTIEERSDESYPDDLVKSFPITLLKKLPIRDVPIILASMKSNPNFAQSTFQDIPSVPDGKYAGNVAAIRHLLGSGLAEGYNLSRIDCLSSIEFETLVAKLLEEAGLFVPAYKGGFMKDVDLMASNDGREEIAVGEFRIPGGGTKTIQVKLRADNAVEARGNADYLVTGSDCSEDFCFGRVWLSDQLAKYPHTNAWFHRSTKWADDHIVNCDA